MTKVKGITKGSVLSETSFYKVKEVNKDHLVVTTDDGQDVKISNEYVEKILDSADHVVSEEKKTMTELAELFIGSPRIAMTVAFFKKEVAKTKKAYEAEKKARIDEIQSARVAEVPALLEKLIENPISKSIPGELRVMKGRHYGSVDELGRVSFIDMEKEKGTGATDARLRQVDPRTIQYLIIAGVKYILK
jgi:hypothetical protein